MASKQKKKIQGAALIGIDVAKEDDLGEWYQQVLTKGQMISYYDVAGCYILEPNSYFVWETIQHFFNERIRQMGVRNCYFPLFISADNLQREKDHLEGFAAEVAWVTRGGRSELEKPLAVRPTSETAMYGYFADKIRSHRDLPLRLNQWNNVVRWEFKHPMPFIRSREFLWQEGHTAHLTREGAGEEVLQILEHYAAVYEQLLAVPVVRGRKTGNEQFPGADYTTTLEGYVPATGRGIQAATSHCLGQHFSKMFSISVEDPAGKAADKLPPIHVWQNSWGLSTRSIGAMVLLHGDNKGLVIPPRVAETQVILVPVGVTAKTSEPDRDAIYRQVADMAARLRAAPARVRADTDMRDGYSPGWKFNDWELKGVPLRLEFGPKDAAARLLSTARRDTGEKGTIAIDDLLTAVPALLDQIQADMYRRAEAEYAAHRVQVATWHAFIVALNGKNVCLAPHCLDGKCEDEIKEASKRSTAPEGAAPEDSKAPSMGAKSLCIPFEQPAGLEDGSVTCIRPGCDTAAKKWILFGRSY